jgi:hypothetical protein
MLVSDRLSIGDKKMCVVDNIMLWLWSIVARIEKKSYIAALCLGKERKVVLTSAGTFRQPYSGGRKANSLPFSQYYQYTALSS